MVFSYDKLRSERRIFYLMGLKLLKELKLRQSQSAEEPATQRSFIEESGYVQIL